MAVTPLWTRSEAHGALRDLPRPGPRAQAVIAVASLAFCAAVLLLGTWTVQATILAITAALVLVTVWLDAANTT
ncbi:hypothetical protein [Conexibacter sp. SYSU D00693]|uniref:hypothetical protein n=1 Tax=Conexibacter sp. SYSU D00693 TaxID=2812560 RepID=UPI00196A3F46|nr:hypothetical protein [Conexibacter sp. SYSU D00693]